MVPIVVDFWLALVYLRLRRFFAASLQDGPLSQVQPLILAMILVPEIHSPTSEYCGKCNCCFVWFRILSFFCLWRFAVIQVERHMCRQISSLHSSWTWHMTWGCQRHWQNAFVHCFFKQLEHGCCFSFPDGLVPFRTLPHDALLFPSLLSHLGDRLLAERERGRSCLRFALSLVPSSCLDLQESPLEQCPLTNRRLQSPWFLSFLLLLSLPFRRTRAPLAVLSFWFKYFWTTFLKRVQLSCSFFLHCIFIVPGKDGPELF